MSKMKKPPEEVALQALKDELASRAVYGNRAEIRNLFKAAEDSWVSEDYQALVSFEEYELFIEKLTKKLVTLLKLRTKRNLWFKHY